MHIVVAAGWAVGTTLTQCTADARLDCVRTLAQLSLICLQEVSGAPLEPVQQRSTAEPAQVRRHAAYVDCLANLIANQVPAHVPNNGDNTVGGSRTSFQAVLLH